VVSPVVELLALLGIVRGFAIGTFPLVPSVLMPAPLTFANAIFATAAVPGGTSAGTPGWHKFERNARPAPTPSG
jgi:hypothetical protein